jgi:NDP-sugar pyrophosphorylase family protein
VVGDFRGLVRAFARTGDELCKIAGPGCPYTLPVGGRALIALAVKAVCDAGAKQILVAVDGSIAESVVPVIGEPNGAEVHIAIQPEGDDDATARAVEKVLGPGPLLFMAGDALAAEPAREQSAPADDAVIELEAAWRYDGTVDSLLEANTLALDGMKRGRVGVDLSNASVQGRVHIDPSAELDGAKLRGPAYIGAGARLVETYVGPYTTVGAGVTLEGVEIENSIVLPDAQIRYPGRRLEASLVGEGAQIGRDYSLPSALRLRVGPGSEIQLS